MIDLSEWAEWDDDENEAFITAVEKVINMFKGQSSDEWQSIIVNIMKSAWCSSAAFQLRRQQKLIQEAKQRIEEQIS